MQRRDFLLATGLAAGDVGDHAYPKSLGNPLHRQERKYSVSFDQTTT
jgi:hypothetical protein